MTDADSGGLKESLAVCRRDAVGIRTLIASLPIPPSSSSQQPIAVGLNEAVPCPHPEPLPPLSVLGAVNLSSDLLELMLFLSPFYR